MLALVPFIKERSFDNIPVPEQPRLDQFLVAGQIKPTDILRVIRIFIIRHLRWDKNPLYFYFFLSKRIGKLVPDNFEALRGRHDVALLDPEMARAAWIPRGTETASHLGIGR